jgi:ribosomal protein S18 acetylase RimI-like enzyme
MIIDSVITREQYRNQGYGSKLIEKAIELARKSDVDAIELVVEKDNVSAKRLYENACFKLTTKDYYRLILNKWMT